MDCLICLYLSPLPLFITQFFILSRLIDSHYCHYSHFLFMIFFPSLVTSCSFCLSRLELIRSLILLLSSYHYFYNTNDSFLLLSYPLRDFFFSVPFYFFHSFLPLPSIQFLYVDIFIIIILIFYLYSSLIIIIIIT